METFDICVYDSGVGGLNIFKCIVDNIKNKKIIYYADTINSPYGNKSKHKLRKILLKNIKKIINNYNCKIIVLACNTATVVGFDLLKNKFKNNIFIGTIPNLNFNINVCDKILIIATKQTINSKLIKNIKINNIVKFGSKNLAKLVEDNFLNIDAIKYRFKQELKPILKINFNKIVLGCTHYKFLEGMFLSVFPNAQIYDNTLIVTHKVLENLRNKNYKINKLLKNNEKYVKNNKKEINFKINKKNKIKIISTDILQELKIKKYLNLI